MSFVTRYRKASGPSPRRLLWLVVVLILVLQTALAARAASIHGFATGDGGVKLWQVLGILHTGQLDAPIDYPGAKYDPDHKYAPFVAPWFFWQNGKPYSEYTSPFIWVSVPLYAWFGHAGLLVLPWLSGALIVIVAAWLAWRLHPTYWAVLAPIIVGLSSPLLLYSLEFWEHTTGVLLAVLALAALIKADDNVRPRVWWMIAGAAIGLGLTMRAELYVYPIAIIIGWLTIRRIAPGATTLGAYSLRETARRVVYPMAWVAVGGLLTAGPWWLYQALTWGSPFGPRIQQNVPFLGGAQMLARLGDTTGHNYAMLWPIDGDGAQVVGVLLIAAVVLALGLRIIRRIQQSASRMQQAGFWLLAVVLIAIVGVTAWRVAQGQRPNDLLTTFPVVLVLLLPVRSGNSKPSDTHRFLLVTSAVFILAVLFVSPFEGGIQWGPRFLLPVIVPLAIVVLARVERLWQAWQRPGRIGLGVVFATLLIGGIYTAENGVEFMRQGQISSEFMAAVIQNSAEQVVVADTWFLPQGAPYTYTDKIWLMAEDEQDMFNLLQMLRKQTSEPGFIYVSALTWAHIDPGPRMGPRIKETGGRIHVDAPTQYIELSHYLLLK